MQAKRDMPERYRLKRPDLAQAVAVELSGLGLPAATDRLPWLRPIQRSDARKAQRQRNVVRCLFITRYARQPWSKDQATPAKFAENEEANGIGIRHKRQNAVGLGNRPLATDCMMPYAPTCRLRLHGCTATRIGMKSSRTSRGITEKFHALLASHKTVMATKKVATVLAEMGPIEADSGEAAAPDESGARGDLATGHGATRQHHQPDRGGSRIIQSPTVWISTNNIPPSIVAGDF